MLEGFNFSTYGWSPAENWGLPTNLRLGRMCCPEGVYVWLGRKALKPKVYRRLPPFTAVYRRFPQSDRISSEIGRFWPILALKWPFLGLFEPFSGYFALRSSRNPKVFQSPILAYFSVFCVFCVIMPNCVVFYTMLPKMVIYAQSCIIGCCCPKMHYLLPNIPKLNNIEQIWCILW